MGSMVSFGIERMVLEWGKNHSFNDFSAIFQPSDERDIPYYYAENTVETYPGMSRKLGSVAKRLNLLGFSEAELRAKFDKTVEAMPEITEGLDITFEQFSLILRSIDLSKAFKEFGDGDFDLASYVNEFLLKDPEVAKSLPHGLAINKETGRFFENFEPFLLLRILAQNPANTESLVQWRTEDIIAGGWVERDDIIRPLPNESKILIVTEGSSDSSIIKKALNTLYPDIADFFDFVDMEENYPFTGTGSLFRFCQGLSRIRIQNQVLVIFDNDAAGLEKYQEALNLTRPRSMHICRLPDHPDFLSVMTKGPNGEARANINGAAVAIECFLDWNSVPELTPTVRWSSYSQSLDCYQGELERKEHYVRKFHKANLTHGKYDTAKLRYLIEHLLNEWIRRPS